MPMCKVGMLPIWFTGQMIVALIGTQDGMDREHL